MLRWLAFCLTLAVGSFAVVAASSYFLWPAQAVEPRKQPSRSEGSAEPGGNPPVVAAPGAPSRAESRESRVADDRPVNYVDAGPAKAVTTAPQIIQDARILSTELQEVPSERDGKLLCLATPIRPGERVPEEKIIEVEVGFLAVEATIDEAKTLPPEEKVIFPDAPKRVFRKARDTDVFQPEQVVVARQKVKLRKLEVGDRVERGQLLAVVNPVLALDELAIKVAKLDAAEADRRSSNAFKLEAERKVSSMNKQRAGVRNSVTDDDFYGAKLAVEKYREEEMSKASQLRQSQRELNAALTTLKMHEIRAAIPGTIKVLYKRNGEAVKNLENVLQIQNPNLLRVDGQVEVQDALVLRKRLHQARFLDQQGKVDEARDLAQVIVEASRPEPPKAILRGHWSEVTCVAVSKGPRPLIVSGSEDRTVRIWEEVPGQSRWHERYRLDHSAPLRAVACTPQTGAGNYLITGTTAGRLRRFDLTSLKGSEKAFDGRHSGAVTSIAISPNGTLAVSGGDDRALCVWDVESGKQLHRVSGAHGDRVTYVQFASNNQFISVGRDKRLVLWNVNSDKAPSVADEVDRRSGEVPALGVSPDGQQVLFDDARDLRVLSIKERRIVGTLQNAPGAVGFSTMALFSPDGKTILTNGQAPGRLQLWRAPSDTARAAELRQYIWTGGVATCGAFSPDGTHAVTGTQDHQVLVWDMPSKEEAEKPLTAQLYYVEEFLDSSLKRVPVRAELKNPGWVIPGVTATIVIPPKALPLR